MKWNPGAYALYRSDAGDKDQVPEGLVQVVGLPPDYVREWMAPYEVVAVTDVQDRTDGTHPLAHSSGSQFTAMYSELYRLE